VSEDDNSHRSVCFTKACASLHELQQQTKPIFLTSYCFGVLEEVIIKAVLYDLSESERSVSEDDDSNACACCSEVHALMRALLAAYSTSVV
jgi:hypothetical protein